MVGNKSKTVCLKGLHFKELMKGPIKPWLGHTQKSPGSVGKAGRIIRRPYKAWRVAVLSTMADKHLLVKLKRTKTNKQTNVDKS